MKNICMVGAGYVGLTTGICLSDNNKIFLYDIDEEKIKNINNGILPIYELGLSEKLENNKQNISTGSKIKDINIFDYIIVCLPTPTINDKINMNIFYEGIIPIIKQVEKHITIVIKSTVELGTSINLFNVVKKLNKVDKITLISNPEFLREGNALWDFYNPDRYVYGYDGEVLDYIYEYHALFSSNQKNVILTNSTTAEMIKYASNSFLATKITFINEISQLSNSYNLDMNSVAKGMGLDKRIGDKFLEFGLGYGGSCFPKDTRALCNIAKNKDFKLSIIESTINYNDKHFIKLIEDIITNEHKYFEKEIALVGISFKENTDDLRESIALKILELLERLNLKITLFDPIVKQENFRKENNSFPVIYNDIEKNQIDKIDIMIICNKWEKLNNLNNLKLEKELSIYDGRNQYSFLKSNDLIKYHSFY